tara:strand:- start:2014 stop:2319 length:306 start_codon:yes stop_codon:yes gene_type:complete
MKDNTTNKTIAKKRGRPSIDVEWPNVEFTARDVLAELKKSTGKEITPTAIRVKMRKAVKDGVIFRTGKKADSVGRPLYTYRKCCPTVDDAGVDLSTGKFTG